MESKEKRTWGGKNAHWNFRSKVIDNERKKLTDHEIIARIAEQTVGDHSSEQRIEIEDSSELTEATFFIYLFI